MTASNPDCYGDTSAGDGYRREFKPKLVVIQQARPPFVYFEAESIGQFLCLRQPNLSLHIERIRAGQLSVFRKCFYSGESVIFPTFLWSIRESLSILQTSVT